jgi:D-aspartate ligase
MGPKHSERQERAAMSRKRILITGASTDSGLSILRQLAESGHEVIGADWRGLPLMLRSRYLRTVHLLPKPTDPDFDRGLLELVKILRPDVFLPLVETNVVASACRQEAAIQGLTAINVPPNDAFKAAFDKALCSSECKDLGIPCPAAHSLEEASRILAAGGGRTTLVVKPGTDAGMAQDVEFVRDIEALRRSASSCKCRFGSVLIQEFIPGDVSHMHTAVVLFDRNSELIAAFTMQKLRQWPSAGGVTALGVSTDEFRLVEGVLPFFRKWRWSGAAEVELKFDPRDGQYKVIEINPRFPGYLRFPIICGLPLALLSASLAMKDKTIAPLKYPSYAVGMKYANPGFYLRTTLADMRSARDKAGTLKQAFADLAGTGPAVMSILTDPLPIMGRLLFDIRRPTGG